MVFATREEEIDYLRDELERAGYDEGSNQKWDEATLGRVRKLRVSYAEKRRGGKENILHWANLQSKSTVMTFHAS